MEPLKTPTQRLAEIQSQLPALIALKPLLVERREEAVKKLIASENAEARGCIKQLDYLLELPRWLEQEAVDLSQRTTENSAR